MDKKHPRNSRQPSELSSEQLERKACDDMAAARFRKARDTYKILCKHDREKYLPGLIEANRRLAEQLMENGLVSEAKQVLDYLKTIAPSSSLRATEVCLALKRRDWQSALEAALRLCNNAPTAMDERDRAAAADALVLAFPDFQGTGTVALPEASDLTAVMGAMRCVSEERWEQAQELLRPVPRGSLFAAWKIFVKGMIAFYARDPEKAKALFAQLPPHGVPARAAGAFRLFLGSHQSQEFDDAARKQAAKGACCLLAATDLERVLMRADEAWRAAKHVDSYKEMRQAPGFPSAQPDLAGALTDFYFKAPLTMRDAAYDKYLGWFNRLAESGRFVNDREAQFTYRMLGCAELDFPFHGKIEHFWRMFLRYTPEDTPLSAKIASLALEKVGTQYAQREEANPFSFNEEGERLRNAQDAIALLEESIECDPSNLGAYFRLLEVYELAEQENDRNRLLDRMAQIFPKDKQVLLHAGRESLERKAYVKGIQYLERAHSLDALDPEVLETLVAAYTHHSRQLYEKRKVNKGRHMFDLARRYANRDGINFIRGLDFLQALQGVLESTFGDQGMGLRLMAAARECTCSLEALLFFAHGNSRLHQRKRESIFWVELSRHQGRVINARVRKEVYLAFEFVRSLDEALDWGAEIAFVRKCLAPLGSGAFSREEALYFVPLLARDPPFVSLALAIISEALRRDPGDLRFRLYSEFARGDSPSGLDIEEVTEIYHDAIEQGDKKTAQIAKSAMECADFVGPSNEEEEDFGLTSDQLEEMRSMAARMSDAEFEVFRQDSCKFMPLPIFDLIMAQIRGKRSRQSNPERRRGASRKTDQPELFNQ